MTHLRIGTTCIVMMFALGTATSKAQAITALTFPPQPGTTVNFADGVDGWEFIPSVDIQVNTLGYYDDNTDGLLTPHIVGIFDTATQMLVTPAVSVNSSSTLDGLFRFEPIAPVLLNGGQSYTVAGDSTSPFDPLVNNPSGQVFASEVQFVQYRVQLGDFQFPSLLQPGTFYAAANFQFQPVIVPEPTLISPVTLGLLGLFGYFWQSRKRL